MTAATHIGGRHHQRYSRTSLVWPAPSLSAGWCPLLAVLLLLILFLAAAGLATGQSTTPWSDVRVEVANKDCFPRLILQDQLDSAAWFLVCSSGWSLRQGLSVWRSDTQNLTALNVTFSSVDGDGFQLRALLQDPFDGRLLAAGAFAVYRLERNGTNVEVVVPPQAVCEADLQAIIWSPLNRRLYLGCTDEHTYGRLYEVDLDAPGGPASSARLLLDLPSVPIFYFTMAPDNAEVLVTTRGPTVYAINATRAPSVAVAILQVNGSLSTVDSIPSTPLVGGSATVLLALRLSGAHRDILITLESPIGSESNVCWVAYRCDPNGVPLSGGENRLVLFTATSQLGYPLFVWDPVSLSLIVNLGGQVVSLQWLASPTNPPTVTVTSVFLLNLQNGQSSVLDIRIDRSTLGDAIGPSYWLVTSIGVLSLRGQSTTTIGYGRDCPTASTLIYNARTNTLVSGCSGDSPLVAFQGGQNALPLVNNSVCIGVGGLAFDPVGDALYASCFYSPAQSASVIFRMSNVSTADEPTLTYLALGTLPESTLSFQGGVLFVLSTTAGTTTQQPVRRGKDDEEEHRASASEPTQTPPPPS